jgi:hypothetical protein
MPDRTYRCLECLEHTLTRPFDVSHLSVTCPVCGEFQRFVNEDVYNRFQSFEADPPDSLDWDRLGKTEKLMVSDQVVRKGRDIEDFDIEKSDPAPDAAGDDAAGADGGDSVGAETDRDADTGPNGARPDESPERQ